MSEETKGGRVERRAREGKRWEMGRQREMVSEGVEQREREREMTFYCLHSLK